MRWEATQDNRKHMVNMYITSETACDSSLCQFRPVTAAEEKTASRESWGLDVKGLTKPLQLDLLQRSNRFLRNLAGLCHSHMGAAEFRIESCSAFRLSINSCVFDRVKLIEID